MARRHTRIRSVRFVTDYNDQSESLVIPEDLTALSAEDLTALHTQAVETFNALYQGGNAEYSDEDLNTLEDLTSGIESLAAEVATRQTQAAARTEAAAGFASRVLPVEVEEEVVEVEAPEAEVVEVEAPEEEVEAPEALAASARKEVRVSLSNIRRQAPAAPATPAALTIKDVAFAATETGGSPVGSGVDFLDMGKIVDRRLATFNNSQYATAAAAGRRMRQQFGVATIQKPHGDLMIRSDSISEAEEVIKRATNLNGRNAESLVASGGWCAPSEILYDVYDCGEVADGLISLPTLGIQRGGIKFNRGVGFNDLLTQAGFFYTEDQDSAGQYGTDANGVGNDTDGSKRCFHIECVDFEEARLALDGLCLTAGLLQSRGYPEVIADTIRKALVAHEIRMDSRKIAAIVAGSTHATLPAGQIGATAPVLTAIELQAQHYRSAGALADNTVLEGIFPQWVRGAIRSDLSRRLGVDLISVPNSRINQWFTDRQIAPQFVANWQSVATTAASGFTAWPTSLDFLLYKAGTWINGTSDVITLDNVYDSTLLGTNDYTALFTEEGQATFRRGCDSRLVTVSLCANGDTGGNVAIDCDGSAGA